MPRNRKKSSAQRTKEFQEREFPGRIKAQRARNVKVLDPAETVGRKQVTRKRRAAAQASEKALSRVEKRSGKKSTAHKPGKAVKMSRMAALGSLIEGVQNVGSRAKAGLRKFKSLGEK